MVEAKRQQPLLHIQDLYKQYGNKMILDDIDLSVAAGELCTVVGPSGCGKSTLLRLILGQERPTSGTLLMEGEPVGFANTDRGVVYQRYSLFSNMTVLENVMLGRKLTYGISQWFRRRKRSRGKPMPGPFEWFRRKKEFRDEAMAYLEKVRLAEHWMKYPHELSGGMQQRVAIAQSLIMHPKILLMDEPFGALDPGTREDLQVFLLELWDEYKMTIFFVTHDLEEASFLGTRIIVLSQFYTDGRGRGANRGAKIVADYALQRQARSTVVKESAALGEMIQRIRREGFNPEYRQHVTDFNLEHVDSFQTLEEDVAREMTAPEPEEPLEVAEEPEAAPEESETAPEESETAPEEPEAKPKEGAEPKPEEAEAVVEAAEAKPEEAGAAEALEEAEAKPEEPEAKPEEAEAKPEEPSEAQPKGPPKGSD